ncbi:sulfotransferase family protein [Actinopolymorpha sp. B17G11]|uniref:sulfotransferase family protein n=1 Tax=unclassified Actinopolymorpha TaxID=2627063 RepID=UPI0032D971B6
MLKVIGAGFPRTGTYSLRAALMTILGGDCYHMRTVNEHDDHVAEWRGALRDEPPEWHSLFEGCTAAVDWPVSSFWREISAAFPDALILLSVRKDAGTWWRSFDENILPRVRRPPEPGRESRHAMSLELLAREIGPHWDDEGQAVEAYERHLDNVRTTVPSSRLLVWQAEQGWPPLCQALDVPIPSEPFPCLNTTAQRRQYAKDRIRAADAS